MPHKFATCTVKHFFKKKAIAKKVLNNSKSSEFLKWSIAICYGHSRPSYVVHLSQSFEQFHTLFLYSHPISTVCVGNAIKWYIMISSHLPRVMKLKKKKKRNKGFDCKLGQDYIEYILKLHCALKISLTVWSLADIIRTRL